MKRMMKKNITITVVIFFTSFTCGMAQQLMGLVTQRNEQGLEEAVAGANVYWLGTTTGTTTGSNGVFRIDRIAGNDRLVVSYIGFTSDTLTIAGETNVKVELPVMLSGPILAAAMARSPVPVATSSMVLGAIAATSFIAFLRQPLSIPRLRK